MSYALVNERGLRTRACDGEGGEQELPGASDTTNSELSTMSPVSHSQSLAPLAPTRLELNACASACRSWIDPNKKLPLDSRSTCLLARNCFDRLSCTELYQIAWPESSLSVLKKLAKPSIFQPVRLYAISYMLRCSTCRLVACHV